MSVVQNKGSSQEHGREGAGSGVGPQRLVRGCPQRRTSSSWLPSDQLCPKRMEHEQVPREKWARCAGWALRLRRHRLETAAGFVQGSMVHQSQARILVPGSSDELVPG